MRGPTLAFLALLSIQPLEAQCPDGGQAPCRATETPPAPTSVAVLDFRNLSRDSADAYLAEGLAEELTSRLGKVARLVVISRASVKRLRDPAAMSISDVGRALRSAFLVNGSVQRAGVRLRVRVELLRADNGVQAWSDVFDRSQADVLEIQDEVATEVTTAIAGRLLPAERSALARKSSTDPAAIAAYHRALILWRSVSVPGDRSTGLAQAEQAIARDSTFAAAHALVAMFHAAAFWWYDDRTPERLERSRRAADRAVALAPSSAEPHLARGLYFYWGFLDYDRAMAAFNVALRYNASHAEVYAAMANVQRRMPRWQQAIASRVRAAELDPLNQTHPFELGDTYVHLRRFGEAERAALAGMDLVSADAGPFIGLAQLRLHAGDTAGAHEALRQAMQRRSVDLLFAPTGYGYLLRGELVRIDSALQAHVLSTPSPADENGRVIWHAFRGLALTMRAQSALARAHFDSARVIAERFVAQRPGDDAAHALLGNIYARLGRHTDAVRVTERSAALRPVRSDAFVGPSRLIDLTEVLILAGKHEEAITMLEELLAIPARISRHALRYDPLYDSLRQNPRFQRLVR